jgi:Tol biopolymer transport system component
MTGVKIDLLRVAGLVTTCLLSGLAACSAATPQATPRTSTSESPMMSASASPTNPQSLSGHLLFSRWDNTTQAFASHHVSRADGSERTTIKMPGTQGDGRWSHSTQQIAASIELDHDQVGTAIIDAHGKVVRVLELPDKTINMVCNVWSRDDLRLACETWDDANPDRAGIYTVRAADGKEVKRLTSASAGNQDLAGDYSPDGRGIVFRRTVDGENGPLMVLPVDGGEPRQIADMTVETSGRYSPDGQTVVASIEGDIVFFDVASGKIVNRISEEGHTLFSPSWSPDGTWVAYLNTLYGEHRGEVYISHPDGSDARNITNTPESETVVDWGP